MIYLSLDINKDDTFCLRSESSRSISALGLGYMIGTARENMYKASVITRGMINRGFKNTKPVKRPIKIIGKCFMKDTIPQEI